MIRRRRNNNGKLAAGVAAVVVTLGGFAYMGVSAYSKKTPDLYGCYDGVYQPHTVVFVDGSTPRWNAEQQRSLRTFFDKLYGSLGFNERLSIFTSEGDQIASVVAPRFHVCGQATAPEQLIAINAEAGHPRYLQKQRERLYQKMLAPELDALLAIKPEDKRRQDQQSPILEMIADISRREELEPGSRLIVVSDLLQNSDTASFCRVQNDMPNFYAFKQRRIYERVKPRSLEGVEVTVLMLQREGYGHFGLEHCVSEEELKNFFMDYWIDNGVKTPQFIRIRHGVVGA